MSAGTAFREHRRILRLYCYDLHARVLFLEKSTCTGDRSACSYTCDEDINFTVEVFPDLGTCRCLMHGRVCRVGELRWDQAVRDLLVKFFCFCDRALHALRAFRKNEFCAVSLHELSSFDGHRVRHYDDRSVSSCCCYSSKTDTCVTGCRLDDRCCWLQDTLCLCVIEHRLCDTVLDGSARIKVLQFCEYLCNCAGRLFKMCQFEDRCFSDQLIC